jgi:hypothetical protein
MKVNKILGKFYIRLIHKFNKVFRVKKKLLRTDKTN